MSTTYTLTEIAALIGAKIVGADSVLADKIKISSIASLEKANSTQVAFLSNKLYSKFLSDTKAAAVLLDEEFKDKAKVPAIVVSNPRLALTKIAKLFDKENKFRNQIHSSVVLGEGCEISQTATIMANTVIEDNVKIADNVFIGAGCVIGSDSVIGENSIIKSNVTIYHDVKIGKNSTIHSGTVIGSDGFGFANDNGKWVKMPHLGGVTIGDDVDIGANTTVDRGFIEDTLICNGVIIDNQVQIAHNVSLGEGTAIAGCVGIAGSTKVGKYCLIGGGASIAGHIDICDKVIITATSSVNRSIKEPGSYSSGMPAKKTSVWLKNITRINFLDSFAKRLKALEQKEG